MLTTIKHVMRKKILGATLTGAVICFAAYAQAATSVTVTVNDADGNGISSAIVYAIQFGDTGPNATNSVIATCLTNGTTVLTLTDAVDYEIFAASAGYGPTLRKQMFDPTHTHVLTAGSDVSVSVTLDETLSGKGTLAGNVTNASANSMLFGNVLKTETMRDVAFGACETDGAGDCVIFFYNVNAVDTANTYDVGVFDPALRGGEGQGVGKTLTSTMSANAITYITLDLDDGLPPDFSATDGSKSFEQENRDEVGQGGASVEGVVQSTHTIPVAVPWGHVELRVRDGSAWYGAAFSPVDEKGRFRFFGLEAGVTYYVVASGGCRWNENRCFEGYESTGTLDGELKANDFVHSTSTVRRIIELQEVQPGTGALDVYVVNSDGVAIPGAHINFGMDGFSWHTDPGQDICDGNNWHAVDISSPGFSMSNSRSATGYAHITGLQPGNYQIQVWTPFSRQPGSFNAGDDNVWSDDWNNHRGCYSGSYDDLRLTVEADDTVNVYNTSGTIVRGNISSVTVTVPTTQNTNASVTGTITFPRTVDLLDSNPPESIMISYTACGDNGCNGNFAAVPGTQTASNQYTYEVNLASADDSGNALTYYTRMVSHYWGPVMHGGGEHQISFQEGNLNLVRNYDMVEAGVVNGKLYKPDGSLFKPGQQSDGMWVGAGISAQGITTDSYQHTEVQDDGSFSIGGLIPGEYYLVPQIWGGAVTYAAREPLDKVTIVANTEVYKDAYFVEGEMVQVSMDTTTFPSLINGTIPGDDYTAGESYMAIRYPAGSLFTADSIPDLLMHELNENQIFGYINTWACGDDWSDGWCPQRVPKNKAYDIYFMRGTSDMYSDGTNEIYPYFTMLGSTKNVVIDGSNKTGPPLVIQMSTVATLMHVTHDPGTVTEGVIVTGGVTAENMIRQSDFEAFGGDFNNFMKYIPIIALYDSSGTLQAGGIVIPPPSEISEDVDGGDEIDIAVANGDWSAFLSSFGGLPFAYEIRGVLPNKTYTMVGTTPNYPPFTATITTGDDGTTTTQDINWDTDVGAGATINGVVQTTATVAIENATVLVKTRGAKEKKFTTDENGQFAAEGLQPGSYKITANAPGYAPMAAIQDVSGTDSADVTIELIAATATITGTVRELALTAYGPIKRPIAGTNIFAYDDTYNVANPEEPLAIYKVQTSSIGVFTIPDVIGGDVYKVTVCSPGRYIEVSSVTAAATGVDFDLEQKPLDVEVFASIVGTNYEFRIMNPNNFQNGEVWYDEQSAQFSTNSATAEDISNSFEEQPDGSLIGRLALSSLEASTVYTLHIIGYPATDDPPVVKEVTFGRDYENNVQESIDYEICGDETEGEDGVPANEVRANAAGGNSSSVIIDPGSMIITASTSIPNITITEQSNESVSSAADEETTLLGPLMDLTISNINFTDRPLTMCLSMDDDVTNFTNLGIYQQDPNTSEFTRLSGQTMVDPIQRTVCTRLNLNSLLAQGPDISASGGMKALSNDRYYYRNPRAAASGTGAFAVGLVPSSGTVAASGYHQYNFPNPFNLKAKTITPRTGTTGVPTSITGTYIVVSPTGAGTPNVTIRIFNLAGDMVRELKGAATAGFYNYFHWDGKNTSGGDVASGVYFAVVDAPGAPKKEPIKMVVVK